MSFILKAVAYPVSTFMLAKTLFNPVLSFKALTVRSGGTTLLLDTLCYNFIFIFAIYLSSNKILCIYPILPAEKFIRIFERKISMSLENAFIPHPSEVHSHKTIDSAEMVEMYYKFVSVRPLFLPTHKPHKFH